jgi:hypothetical protein
MTCYSFGRPYECANPIYPTDWTPDFVPKYVFADTGEDVHTTVRPCPKCGKLPNPDGTDPCLGLLPGVQYACCGHGVKEPYILTQDGQHLRGEAAVRKFVSEVAP